MLVITAHTCGMLRASIALPVNFAERDGWAERILSTHRYCFGRTANCVSLSKPLAVLVKAPLLLIAHKRAARPICRLHSAPAYLPTRMPVRQAQTFHRSPIKNFHTIHVHTFQGAHTSYLPGVTSRPTFQVHPNFPGFPRPLTRVHTSHTRLDLSDAHMFPKGAQTFQKRTSLDFFRDIFL